MHAHPHRWRQRLCVARGFARHLATVDPASEVPSTDLLPATRPSRIAPYIYPDGEIAALMAAAGELRPRLRAARHQTLIGLLAVTGMRPGEALALDRQDIDLRRGVVHVRAGKQKRQREVPLHESTIGALGEYARQRDGTVNLRSCGRSANHISLIRHTRPGESRRRTGENRPRIAQVDSAVESKTGSPAATTPRQRSPYSSSTPATTRSR